MGLLDPEITKVISSLFVLAMRIGEADTDGSDSFDSLDSTRSQIIKTTRQTLNTADKEDRKVATEPRSMSKYLIMNK